MTARMKTPAELCAFLATEPVFDALMTRADELALSIPEIGSAVGLDQKSPWHCYDVWEHTARAVAAAPRDDTMVRLALLFHDLGKPACFSTDESGRGHFYGHARVSSLIARRRMKALGFSPLITNEVAELVYLHLEDLRPELMERFLFRLGETQLRRLVAVERADSLAHHPHAVPARLTKLDAFSQALDAAR